MPKAAHKSHLVQAQYLPRQALSSPCVQETTEYGKLATSNKALHLSAPLAPTLSKGAVAVLEDRRKLNPQYQAFLMPFGFVPCKAVVRAELYVADSKLCPSRGRKAAIPSASVVARCCTQP